MLEIFGKVVLAILGAILGAVGGLVLGFLGSAAFGFVIAAMNPNDPTAGSVAIVGALFTPFLMLAGAIGGAIYCFRHP